MKPNIETPGEEVAFQRGVIVGMGIAGLLSFGCAVLLLLVLRG